MHKISVIGSGSWGTSLAHIISKKYGKLMLYGRDCKIVEEINSHHYNPKLPGIDLCENIIATNFINDLKDSKIIFLVVPTSSIREICKLLVEIIQRDVIIIICSKGIECISLQLSSDIIYQELNIDKIAVLSGPNFAREIATGLPAAADIASFDMNFSKYLSEKFSTKNFRLYPVDDMISVQLSGAIKNVLAIACGIAEARSLGENARAAIITRGIYELSKLCIAMGGKSETLLGLSTIGDISLTCNSKTSRNHSAGFYIGHGRSIDDLHHENKTLEGLYSIKSIYELAQKYVVDMPISNALYKIIYKNLSIDIAIEEILDREI